MKGLTAEKGSRLVSVQTSQSPEDALAFMSAVLECSTEYAIIATDPSGVILLWNEGARRLYGYAPEEMIWQSWARLTADENPAVGVAEQIAATALREGKSEEEVALVCKDGSNFTARVVVTPRLNSKGVADGFVVISSDVTEEVGLSQELNRAEAYMRSLLESAPDAMVIVDSAGVIQLANAETQKLFGYAREDLIDQPVEMLIPERYRARHPDHRNRFFSDPLARPMGAGLELAGRRHDGSEFPVEISLSPLQTEDGLLATAAIRDVTERKRAEGKFSGLLESAPDAMVIVDQGGGIQLANAATATLFGYSRDELIGRPVETLIPLRYH
jgi:PAS domain S-box-containing protein